ncbi:MAG: hypothetical protein ACT4OK_02945 [Gemmobacter sp.]
MVATTLVFATGVGVLVFDEMLTWPIVLGAAIVVAAGLFTLWRQRVVEARDGRGPTLPGR